MDPYEIRMACLHLAAERDGSIGDILDAARQFYGFVIGRADAKVDDMGRQDDDVGEAAERNIRNLALEETLLRHPPQVDTVTYDSPMARRLREAGEEAPR